MVQALCDLDPEPPGLCGVQEGGKSQDCGEKGHLADEAGGTDCGVRDPGSRAEMGSYNEPGALEAPGVAETPVQAHTEFRV